jgi:hypothetical protein
VDWTASRRADSPLLGTESTRRSDDRKGLGALPAAVTAATTSGASAATTATETTSATGASAATSIFTRPGFVHGERSAIELFPVQTTNGGLRLLIAGHLHETESL